ncbi:hypothetical protein EV14_0446 [Prochlorococcus sp. MIT 0703]|nr:hypothetical protein EV12_0602 [Prochlorococcus sp. MIT 0701]KGG36352.1 hypothetical protein EV14_0446 [Prochlorococcus sp. MIT 0703]
MSRCCGHVAALSSATAGRITKGADANASAEAPVSDKERRTECCKGIEHLKGHSLSGIFSGCWYQATSTAAKKD